MTRQMVMVGFLQAQNCTNLPSSWRHPQSRDGCHVRPTTTRRSAASWKPANSTWRSSTTGWRCRTATATTTPTLWSTASAA